VVIKTIKTIKAKRGRNKDNKKLIGRNIIKTSQYRLIYARDDTVS
jgi:hypothetical protein